MRYVGPLALVCCFLGLPSVAAGDLTDPSQAREWLRAQLEADHGPPSISVAIAVGDEIVLAEAVGFADLAREVPATTSTTYRTYSVSKAVTTIAVMQLVEQDKLDLKAEIQRYVPEFPQKRWPVRLEHLLTHTSGIRHYKKNAGEISSQVEYATLAESLSVFAADPLEFEPGTGDRYTSFGFNLLTGAVESASESSFEDYLAREVFRPAGMPSSSLAVAGREDATLARAYWGGTGALLSNQNQYAERWKVLEELTGAFLAKSEK